MASWLVRSSPDRVVWVRALVGDIGYCSWGQDALLSQGLCLHPIILQCGTGEFNAGGSPAID